MRMPSFERGRRTHGPCLGSANLLLAGAVDRTHLNGGVLLLLPDHLRCYLSRRVGTDNCQSRFPHLIQKPVRSSVPFRVPRRDVLSVVSACPPGCFLVASSPPMISPPACTGFSLSNRSFFFFFHSSHI